MTKRERELKHELMVLAEKQHERLLELKLTPGGHYVARFSRGGPLYVASTPSSSGLWETKSQARRILRVTKGANT